jgi:predicted Zn-dependent peptidase
MIENLVNFFADETDVFNLIGGAENTKKKKKMLIKKTNYTVYDMLKNTDGQINSDKLMKTLIIPLSNANTVTVGIFINAGSRQEISAYGIAHFLEHMTFKGTKNCSSMDLMLKLDSLGASYNAMTGHEFTAYYISGDPRDVEIFLNIIIDLYLYPTFPEEDIIKERNVVLEERRMNEDSTNRVLTNTIFNEIYETSKPDLARPIIGFEHTISTLNRNDIVNYRNQNYNGSNCLLCVSGNFDKDDIVKCIELKFESTLNKLPKQDDLFFNTVEKNMHVQSLLSIKPTIKRHVHVDKDIKQTVINFVFSAFNANNYYLNHLELLGDILSNGFSSRLFNLLRNKMGISYYNNSFARVFEDCGQFIISVGVEHNSVLDAIDGVLKELKNVRENGLSEIELNKAKKQNETSLLFQFKDPYEYLMYYGMNYLKSKPMYNITNMLENIESVTLNDLNAVIRNIFTSNNLLIGTSGKINDSDMKKIVSHVENF